MKRQFQLLWAVIGLLAALALVVMTGSCSGTAAPSSKAAGAATAFGAAPPGVFTAKASGTYYGPGKSPGPFTLKIPANHQPDGDWAACEDNGTLPVEYTCNLTGQSPPLEWSGVPVGTKELAILVWHKPMDPPAPEAKFYWIMWGIKPTTTGLPQNAGAKDSKYGFLGLNEHKTAEFEPTCSSGSGLKMYQYNLFALDGPPQFEKLKLTKNAAGGYDNVTRDTFMLAIKDVTICSTVMRVNTDVGNLAAQSGAAAGAAPAAGGAPSAGTNTGKAPPPPPASSGKLLVTSSAVKEAGNMPDKYTRTGAKAGITTVSPPIDWAGAPVGTQSFAVILSGVSTSGLEEIHWIMYNIPGTTASLTEAVTGVGTEGQKFITPSEGAMGTYKKTITVYALSATITVAEADKADVSKVRAAMEGKILDTGSLNYEFTVN